ncbi:MAG: DUF6612 family protein [Blautia sp.]|jgi:hypothetical protein
MRKFKKWTAAALSLMLLGSLTACQKDEAEKVGQEGAAKAEDTAKELDPLELYTQASEKSRELQDMEMTIDMQMKLMQGEESLDIGSKMDMKIKGNGTDTMEYYTDSVTTLMEQEISSTMFYKDGYYYMDTMGQKYKYAYDVQQLMAQVEESISASAPEISGIQNIAAEEKDGTTILTFDVDPSQMNAYVENALGALGDASQTGSVEIQKVSGTCTVGSEGYFTTTDLNMSFSMDIQGTAVDVEATAASSISNVGDQVTISYPEDLNEYTEVDASLVNPEA